MQHTSIHLNRLIVPAPVLRVRHIHEPICIIFLKRMSSVRTRLQLYTTFILWSNECDGIAKKFYTGNYDRMITSTVNPLIKKIVLLQQKKYRDQEQLFIAEGIRIIETLQEHGVPIEHLFVTERGKKFCSEKFLRESCTPVSDAVMKKISPSQTPSGILAVCRRKENSEIADGSALVLYEVSDPGNMGTLIRSASAFDVRTIFLIGGADPYAPKVVAASAGTIGAITIYQDTWEAVKVRAQEYERILTALVPESGTPIRSIDRKNRWLVLGNEAHGLPSDVFNDCAEKLTIPMPGDTESLNVAVAGSIALYELSR